MIQNLKRNCLVISKLTWGIWWILTQAIESLTNFHFNVLLLNKVYIASAEKVRKSYLSWNWIGIQNLGRNRLAVSKLAKGIWQILTWGLESLKDFHFNGLLMGKLYIVWAKKSTEEQSFMKLKRDTKFGEESTRRFKIGIRNLTKFDPSTWKSQKFSFYWAPFEQSIYSLN